MQNNLLKILRGRNGGYKLTKKPAEYTVGEILELTEGTLAVVSCLEKNSVPCERKNFCKTLPLWQKFEKLKRDFFFSVTLSDLL